MIKEYANNDNAQVAEHFNIQEFKCKCGKYHPIVHDADLSVKLEQLRKALNCSSITVTSGYRCAEYDIAIGGFAGMHSKGLAADIVCYDENGNTISSKLVCCKAQDIGFGGIANIDSGYTATHVDVRSSNFWKGDETISNNTVTDDFYAYYGIPKTNTNVLKGIDISYCQNNINWNNVNVDFVIARAGYGREISQKDSQFENHYKNCKLHNIPIGAYWYSYAESEADTIKEANTCIEILKDKQFEYPIFYDVEEQSQFNKGKTFVSNIIRAFCSTLEKAGYFTGLYMSASQLNNFVDDDIKNNYTIWVAHYGASKPSYSGQYGIWQYSGNGNCTGIQSEVDLNYGYIDYADIIKNSGLNGFCKSSPTPIEKPKKKVKIQIDGHSYEGEVTENG